MAVARESLSPLLRNVQRRRLSLELCQKIGNHLSPSPNSLLNNDNKDGTNNNIPGLSPIPATTRSPANVSMNWSPIKNLYSIFNSESPNNSVLSSNSPQYSPNNGNNNTLLQHHNRRRGSVDQNVFKPFTPSPVSSIYSRRSSLTPITPYTGTAIGNNLGSQSVVLPSFSKFTLPSIHVQGASPDEDEKKRGRPCNINEEDDECGSLFCSPKTLFRDTLDGSTGILQNPGGTTFGQQRRKSSSSRYDFDEDFMRFVFRRCHLELHPEDILGRGSFGTVVQGKYHGESVAVKVIKTKTSSHLESMKGEQNAYGLNHPHIAQVLDIFQMGPERALVVMELCQKGNLGRVLHDSRITIPSSSKIRIAGQIASALQFCHQKGILHLDVKPQNILLDGNDNCKLSDFGTSKRMIELSSFFYDKNKLEGTVAYKAPELFRGAIPTEKCDVYSFGICMWQILTREEPYEGLPEHSIIYQVVACGLRPCRFKNHHVDYQNSANTVCHTLPHYVSIYETCWQSEPNLRPDMTSLVENLLIMLYKV